MHFGSNNHYFKYKMGSTDLDSTTNEKNLGIVFAPDLKWRQQLIACAAKTNSMLGLIKNSFVKFDIRLIRILYMVYIRPLFEFSVPLEPNSKG